jgi:hypothetical protein
VTWIEKLHFALFQETVVTSAVGLNFTVEIMERNQLVEATWTLTQNIQIPVARKQM